MMAAMRLGAMARRGTGNTSAQRGNVSNGNGVSTTILVTARIGVDATFLITVGLAMPVGGLVGRAPTGVLCRAISPGDCSGLVVTCGCASNVVLGVADSRSLGRNTVFDAVGIRCVCGGPDGRSA